MEDQWVPVIEKDVDGSNSLPLTLDRENPNLGRYSASRRVARTIYMGSAPLQKAANRGIEDRQIKLGCVQPGETVATFGDALRRLTDRATFLYVDGKAVLVLDAAHRVAACGGPCRATQRTTTLRTRSSDACARRRTPEAILPKSMPVVPSNDVPDDREARLVILGPEYPHTAKDDNSKARKEAANILDCRGSSPRNYRTPWSSSARMPPGSRNWIKRSDSTLPGIRSGMNE